MMDPEGRCTRCGDYIRDCICEVCKGCLNPFGTGELNDADMCEDCESAVLQAEQDAALEQEVVGVATGLPVYVSLRADGSVYVEVDLSEVGDRPTAIFINGEEVEEDPDQLVARLELALTDRTTLTHTIYPKGL